LLTVTTEPLEKCEVLVTIQVDETRADHLLKAAAKRIASQVQVPGFRPGKAPYALVVRRFGEDAIRKEALEDLGETVFREALKEASLEPYAPASMEDVTWEPLTMKVRVPVAPVVEIGDYRSLRLEETPVEVTESQVEEALLALQDERAAWKPVERPANVGDKVKVAARVTVGGKTAVDDKDAELVLRERDEQASEPDLVTPLVAMSAGEEKTFNVTYPEDYHDKELAGEDATVWVGVREVQEKELFPLDDDFAQMVGDFGALQELKDRLRADLLERKRQDADRDLASKAFETISSGATRVEWPLAFENEAVERWIGNLEQRLRRQGMPLDDYLRTQRKTLEQLHEEVRPGVQQQLRLSLVASEISRREGLSVARDEVLSYVEAVSNLAGERRQEMLRSMATEAGVRQATLDLLDAKMRERLVQIVKGLPVDEAAGPSAEGQAAAPPEGQPQERSGSETEPETGETQKVDAPSEAQPGPNAARRKSKAAAATPEEA
jgi:trigger factor